MTKEKLQYNQQFCPSGKSLPIFRNDVKPQNKKYFAFSEGQISTISVAIPTRSEGRIMIVTNVGRGAMDAKAATDERGWRVRRRRVVLTPRTLASSSREANASRERR
jgi:hypothetical protein